MFRGEACLSYGAILRKASKQALNATTDFSSHFSLRLYIAFPSVRTPANSRRTIFREMCGAALKRTNLSHFMVESIFMVESHYSGAVVDDEHALATWGVVVERL